MRKTRDGSRTFLTACFLFYYYCLSSIHRWSLKATRQGPTNLPGSLYGSQAGMICSPLVAPSVIILDPNRDMIEEVPIKLGIIGLIGVIYPVLSYQISALGLQGIGWGWFFPGIFHNDYFEKNIISEVRALWSIQVEHL